jgi:hypothetical protein
MDCSECFFRVNDESGKQIDCQDGRIHKFLNNGKAELKDSYYELKQFCTMYRPEDWDKTLEVAQQEVKTSYGIVISSNGEEVSDILKSMDSVKNLDYEKGYFKLVLSLLRYDKGVNKIMDKVNRFVQNEIPCEAVFHMVEDWWVNEKAAFNKVSSGSHFVYMRAGTEIRPNLLQVVEKSVNKDLEQISLFEDNGVSIAPKSIINKLYLEYAGYERCLNGLREIAQAQGVYRKYEE